MQLILFDSLKHLQQLLPLTFTRPVSELRCGIFTLREKWERHFGKAFWLTATYLTEVFPCSYQTENLYILGALLESENVLSKIKSLKNGQALFYKDTLLAFVWGKVEFEAIPKLVFAEKIQVEDAEMIERPWHIFQKNGAQIRRDFEYVRKIQKSHPIEDPHTRVYCPENIFIGKNVKLRAAVLNAETGPIYIGDNCEIQEGCVIRAPFVICEGSTLNMGARMRGDITIGPMCKAGGEISNSIMLGYSNKAHDGFMGNSVVGEWCNLGADTNISNLKNTYSNVKVWSYAEKAMVDTGAQFCGLTMGDFSKSGINTMFNTGTVVGVFANVFDGGFPPKHIPSFSWGKSEKYEFDKAIETLRTMMSKRGKSLSKAQEKMLRTVFEITNQ
jgi:UDP-N-acetylglucosamine diphosphorylase/glucosamine-1-phosphate N-acetyltransferase